MHQRMGDCQLLCASPGGPRPQSGANIDPEDVTIDEHEGISRFLQVLWIFVRQL